MSQPQTHTQTQSQTQAGGVLITGASPDRANRNVFMRGYVAEGFAEVLGADRVRQVPLEQAARAVGRTEPRLVLCFGSCMPDDGDYRALRLACDRQGAALAFWLHDDPYEFDFGYKAAAVADWIFSNDSWACHFYDHPRVHHLPLAASPRIHSRPIGTTWDIDIFFCGVAFDNRIQLLKDLRGVLQTYNTTVLGDGWPTAVLPFAQNRRLNNRELTDHYARAGITINVGRHFSYANDRYQLDPATPGPRTFEAAMAGAVQFFFVESLEIEDYYRPGEEIVLFDTVEDFAASARELLAAPARRSAIARAAQDRTRRDHTYAQRARRLLEIVGYAAN